MRNRRGPHNVIRPFFADAYNSFHPPSLPPSLPPTHPGIDRQTKLSTFPQREMEGDALAKASHRPPSLGIPLPPH